MNIRRKILLSLLVMTSLVLLGLNQQGSFAAIARFGNTLGTEAYFGSIADKKELRVGIQIGHYKAIEQPDELKNIRYSTGGQSGKVTEVSINLAVAKMLRDMLENKGIIVDMLPATIPPDYEADVFISIHADSSTDLNRRGYKSAYFKTGRNDSDKLLKEKVDESYFYFMGLPDDDENVSGDMIEYYSFNKEFKHSIAKNTAGIIVEIGYISNPEDLQLIKNPVNPAYALKIGILKYLKAKGLID